ncbi:hypothetical protein HanXRQr2_Chr06g0270071 [Helianthus annuus]|uniref:Uncharacterized protein n=1 Tax=Helianthus annuus TaxID=4232 RepID=A0A9K3NL09_HELAN|nr:hypothetical protein HanXRQr2_Chr06g0270071 [Helianthus annuus]KAJ0916354.1 hypothetical protein HanPSC8_Chr06g0260691 [Helianthus annuus]
MAEPGAHSRVTEFNSPLHAASRTCARSDSRRTINTCAGQYAPIPPVFGPVSPSLTRLWSCADSKAKAFSPSTSAKNDASSPSKNSSTIIEEPAFPNDPFTRIVSTASNASCSVVATITPFPAASPSALTTMGAPCSLIYFFAANGSVNVSYCNKIVYDNERIQHHVLLQQKQNEIIRR